MNLHYKKLKKDKNIQVTDRLPKKYYEYQQKETIYLNCILKTFKNGEDSIID